MIAKRIQTALSGIFFLILLAPLLIFGARKVAPSNPRLLRLARPELTGVMPEQNRAGLSRESWFSGTYQQQLSGYLGQTFPLREGLVRLNNELEYRLLRQSSGNNHNIIVGKQRQLYTSDYVNEYCGIRPPMPVARLKELATDIAELQARLKKRGIPFVFVITPSKAALYPEYLPDAFLAYRKPSLRRSYEDFVPLLQERQIPLVDIPALLRQQKTAQPDQLLFVRGGSHWTDLGSFYGTSALIEALNRQKSVPLPTLINSGTTLEPPPPSEDTDLAQLLNGITVPVDYKVPRVALERSGDTLASKKLVVVGGSFCNKLIGPLNTYRLFPSIDFYFYYRRSLRQLPANTGKDVDTKAINWPRDIFDSDAIVLEINEEAFGPTGRDTHYDTFLTDALAHIDKDGNVH